MNDRDNHRSLMRSTGVISAATLVSRVAGLVRDAVILGLWGKSVNDAFLAAYRIPNLFKRLFSEGALSSAFVPIFTDTLQREGEEEAKALASALFRSIALVLGIFCLLAIVFAPQLMWLFVSGFAVTDPGKLHMAENLVALMMPFLWFVGLGAIAMAMLNTLDRFFIPAVSPAILNLTIIASAGLAVLLSHQSQTTPDIRWVAAGVSVGGLLQLLCQMPLLWKRGYLNRLAGPLRHPRLLVTLRLAIPAILGLAVTQVNVLISTWFASFWPGYVTYLYAANRIIQFPLGILGFAIATAALPRLSGDALQSERSVFAGTFSYALRKTLFIMIPASVGIGFIALDAVSLAFDRGEFRAEGSLWPTALAVWAYTIGLAAFSLQKVVVTGFYARKDMKTPFYTGLAAVFLNVLLSIVFVFTLGVFGLALATSLAAMFNVAMLLFRMKPLLGAGWLRPVWHTGLRSIIAALGMAVPCGLVLYLWDIQGVEHMQRLLRLIILSAIGAIFYAGICYSILREEFEDMVHSFRSGRRAPDDTMGE